MVVHPDDTRARPGFLRGVANAFTIFYGFIVLLNWSTGALEKNRQGLTAFGLLWLLIAVPLWIAAFSRQTRLAKFGETFLVTEPWPLIIGQPFTGYLELSDRPTITNVKIVFAFIPRWREWGTGDLVSGREQVSGGRQRVLFCGSIPRELVAVSLNPIGPSPRALIAASYSWRFEVSVQTDRGDFNGLYYVEVNSPSAS